MQCECRSSEKKGRKKSNERKEKKTNTRTELLWLRDRQTDKQTGRQIDWQNTASTVKISFNVIHIYEARTSIPNMSICSSFVAEIHSIVKCERIEWKFPFLNFIESSTSFFLILSSSIYFTLCAISVIVFIVLFVCWNRLYDAMCRLFIWYNVLLLYRIFPKKKEKREMKNKTGVLIFGFFHSFFLVRSLVAFTSIRRRNEIFVLHAWCNTMRWCVRAKMRSFLNLATCQIVK